MVWLGREELEGIDLSGGFNRWLLKGGLVVFFFWFVIEGDDGFGFPGYSQDVTRSWGFGHRRLGVGNWRERSSV
jgi:hypothetical protein